ncbi:hypothetical protein SKAU_G00404530 [Synaphobranchus kaupii]|uniref:Uncharacterized protein n=1 Tax=Synaphobranchus kaupii TaxID=118154 RepID=A0A9Q1ICN9_SYNKA|nr:hypothetical protein SKAU_G00404530 [Synaphobranchus kaupii]
MSAINDAAWRSDSPGRARDDFRSCKVDSWAPLRNAIPFKSFHRRRRRAFKVAHPGDGGRVTLRTQTRRGRRLNLNNAASLFRGEKQQTRGQFPPVAGWQSGSSSASPPSRGSSDAMETGGGSLKSA